MLCDVDCASFVIVHTPPRLLRGSALFLLLCLFLIVVCLPSIGKGTVSAQELREILSDLGDFMAANEVQGDRPTLCSPLFSRSPFPAFLAFRGLV